MHAKIYNDGKGNFFITEPFTHEERKQLETFVFTECDEVWRKAHEEKWRVGAMGTWGYTGGVMQFNPAITFTPENLTQNGFNVCALPLEEIPLHINDDDPYVRAVVKWRLSIGK
jgi:hypothetical protein